MSRYYDRQGQPIDMTTWALRFEDEAQKIVARTEVGDALVSTVWLGLDHNFTGGPPLIFETMVFGGSLDQEQDRYSTEAQALAGHDQMVEKVKSLGHVYVDSGGGDCEVCGRYFDDEQHIDGSEGA